jgi:cation transporter-like permease
VQPSLRKTLVDSHVAAVAIAILIFAFVSQAAFALWGPADRVLLFLIVAGSIRDNPGLAPAPDYLTRQMLLTILTNLLSALMNLAAAWLLSRWVYGTGPLRSLGNYRGKLSRKTNA